MATYLAHYNESGEIVERREKEDSSYATPMPEPYIELTEEEFASTLSGEKTIDILTKKLIDALPYAPTAEEKAVEIRRKRNQYLRDTDWTQLADVALDESEVVRYAVYRRYLRDITDAEGFPVVSVMTFEEWSCS